MARSENPEVATFVEVYGANEVQFNTAEVAAIRIDGKFQHTDLITPSKEDSRAMARVYVPTGTPRVEVVFMNSVHSTILSLLVPERVHKGVEAVVTVSGTSRAEVSPRVPLSISGRLDEIRVTGPEFEALCVVVNGTRTIVPITEFVVGADANGDIVRTFTPRTKPHCALISSLALEVIGNVTVYVSLVTTVLEYRVPASTTMWRRSE